MKPIKVLFIATSHDELGETNRKTGLWLEELASPYYLFKDTGALLTIASPKGGIVPLDPRSLSIAVATGTTKRFLKDADAMEFLANAMILDHARVADYDVVFVTGGHGAMWDIADNSLVTRLLFDFQQAGKQIGLVGQGVSGLLTLQDENHLPWIAGKNLTAFSNTEEESGGLALIVPFLLETRLVALGAIYSKADNHTGYVVVTGNIITGQNAASSEEVAKKLLVGLLKQDLAAMDYDRALLN